jgi:His-Xaa-Ser system protein HxsD
MVKKDVVVIDNLEIDKNKKTVVISVNPRIHPLDIVFSAAYIFIDRAYVMIDGDPNSQILVKLRVKKDDENLEEIGRAFNNELINYQFYSVQTFKNQPLRELIMRRALFTHDEDVETFDDQDVKDFDKKNEIKLTEEEIAIPWKEKAENKEVDESEKKQTNKNQTKPSNL